MSGLGKSSPDRERFSKSDYALKIRAAQVAKARSFRKAQQGGNEGETVTRVYTGGVMKQRIRGAAETHPANSPQVVALAVEAISAGWTLSEFARAALRSTGYAETAFRLARLTINNS